MIREAICGSTMFPKRVSASSAKLNFKVSGLVSEFVHAAKIRIYGGAAHH
jgi:hypothetical protein